MTTKTTQKVYYTIFLGDELWTNVIDENTTEIWAEGGMVWEDIKKAEACVGTLKNPAYGFESDDKKFRVVGLIMV